MNFVEVCAYFEKMATNWDDCDYLDQQGDLEHILRLLKPLKSESGLDLACGAGHLTHGLAATGCQIMAADISEKMLRLTARRIVESKYNNVVIAAQDAHRMEFADGLFYWATCRYGLRYFSDPSKVVAELGRVLKPGGRLYLSDWSSPTDVVNELFSLLDPAHNAVYDKEWWEGEVLDQPFDIVNSRMRLNRIDPVVWGALGGLSAEESLSIFKTFTEKAEKEGRKLHVMTLDERPVLIANRFEILALRTNE
jgi:ubiquinone/menaquinone biosynthesis C-methylase UbiE